MANFTPNIFLLLSQASFEQVLFCFVISMSGNITFSGYFAIVRNSNSSSHVIPDMKRKQVQH